MFSYSYAPLSSCYETLFLRFLKSASKPSNPMLYLITGLGNIGAEYAGTRHNIGFEVVDALAASAGATFEDKRYGAVCTIRVKNKQLLLLKPSTYMNLSGNAVRYWMQEANIPIERTLVVCDDLALPLGTLRMKPSGSDAGHNGLKHIAQQLASQKYARLRFGIGHAFAAGEQVDFVLGKFASEERAVLNQRVLDAAEMVKAFALSGIQFAMNKYNGNVKPMSVS